MLLSRNGTDLSFRASPLAVPFVALAVLHRAGIEPTEALVGWLLLVGLAGPAGLLWGRVGLVRLGAEGLAVARIGGASRHYDYGQIRLARTTRGLVLMADETPLVGQQAMPGLWLLDEYLRLRAADPAAAREWLVASPSKCSRATPPGVLLRHYPWTSSFLWRMAGLVLLAALVIDVAGGRPELEAMAWVPAALLVCAALRWRHETLDTVLVTKHGLACHGYTAGWVLYPWWAIEPVPARRRGSISWYATADRYIAVRTNKPSGARLVSLLTQPSNRRPGVPDEGDAPERH